jgi:hypothetical protein
MGLSLKSLERLAEWYNYVEVVLWWTIGVALARYGSRRPGAIRRRCLLAAVAFGASDWVEARTGNRWWSPWWLFAWKAACVATLAGLAIEARLRRARGRNDETPRAG